MTFDLALEIPGVIFIFMKALAASASQHTGPYPMTIDTIIAEDANIFFPGKYTVHGSDRDPESGLNIDEALSRVTGDEPEGPYIINYVEGLGLYAVVDSAGTVVRLFGRAMTGDTVDEALARYMSLRASTGRFIYSGPRISTDEAYAREMEEALAADADE